MKTLAIFFLPITLFIALWSCGGKEKKVTALVAKDTTAQESRPSEVPDTPSGSVKADEYTEQQIMDVDSYENSEFIFAGSLRKNNGDDILITMYLKARNGSITGKYFYHANPKREDILLKGQIAGDSLMLTEYDPQNKITGRFNGSIQGNDTFEGLWTSPNNKRSLFFKLFFDDMDYDERKTIGLKSDDYAEASGDEQNL
jgi:hypothetical protein